MEEWTLVGRNGKKYKVYQRKYRSSCGGVKFDEQQQHQQKQLLSQLQGKPEVEQVNILTLEIRKKQELISNSNLFSTILDGWKKIQARKVVDPSQIIIYGLGSLASSLNSQFQLALILLLRDKIQVKHLEVFDPVFSTIDICVLQNLGLVIPQGDLECRRNVGGIYTLFYLPHLEKQLINNLLQVNQGHWDKIILLSNRLQNYVEVEEISGVKCPKYIKQYCMQALQEEFDASGFSGGTAFYCMGFSTHQ